MVSPKTPGKDFSEDVYLRGDPRKTSAGEWKLGKEKYAKKKFIQQVMTWELQFNAVKEFRIECV